jgi:hypothetical protein
MNVTITREQSTDQGTFGRLRAEYIGGVFECETLELPWRENRRSLSCIPTGTYQCDWSHSGKFGKVYRLRDVPGRTGILIHAGNYAGDKALGWKSDVEGCILLGMQRSEIKGQAAVLQSRHALHAFVEFMGEKAFRLTIQA